MALQCSWAYSYILILTDTYSNKYIFISYTLSGNDIKSLNIYKNITTII